MISTFKKHSYIILMYILRKKSRCATQGYSGPSCEKAGVERGKIYNDIKTAQSDKKKLDNVNSVGFDIVDCKTNNV